MHRHQKAPANDPLQDWISEALHLSVTALVVPLLASLTGLFSIREALVNFANPIIGIPAFLLLFPLMIVPRCWRRS